MSAPAAGVGGGVGVGVGVGGGVGVGVALPGDAVSDVMLEIVSVLPAPNGP